MKLTDAYNLLNSSQGEHLDTIYVPSLQRTVLFKPITTAHVKTLARSSFIDQFDLSTEILKLGLFDTLCTEDLSAMNISSKTITTFDYLSFLIGIRQMLGNSITFNFNCKKCGAPKSFKETLELDDLFDDIISEYTTQNEIFEKVDEQTNLTYKFELTNYTMLDFLYYKHIVEKLREKVENDPDVLNQNRYLKPLLYIKKVYINDEPIEDWENILLPEKLQFFNKISPSITINETATNKTLIGFINKTFFEEKLIRFIHNLTVECPYCHTKYRGVYDLDNFFTF